MSPQASSRVASAAANGKHGHSLISDAKFRQLYELTLRLRPNTARANGEALAGREAALAAVTSELVPGDTLVAEQPHQAAVAETPFAERVIAAIASATADRLKKNNRVTVVFSSGASADLLRDARAIAAAARLPVLFVEDGSASAKNGKSRTRGKSAANAPQPISIPVDAQDVIALFRVAHESIVRAREGSGPTRILCTRWPSRNGATEDAVEHLEHWLEARGLPAREWRRAILAGGASSGFAEKIFTEVL